MLLDSCFATDFVIDDREGFLAAQLLDSCFATDFVIDDREGFLAAQLFTHLVVQSVVKHLVKLFSRHE